MSVSPTVHAPGRDGIGFFMNQAVLVVEDEPFEAIDIALTFEGEGARTMHAANCRQAQSAIAALGGPEGLIGAVLDVHLGEEETVRPIAQMLAAANVPFVLHTALSARHAREIVGIDAVQITKPSTPPRLIEALRHAATVGARDAANAH